MAAQYLYTVPSARCTAGQQGCVQTPVPGLNVTSACASLFKIHASGFRQVMNCSPANNNGDGFKCRAAAAVVWGALVFALAQMGFAGALDTPTSSHVSMQSPHLRAARPLPARVAASASAVVRHIGAVPANALTHCLGSICEDHWAGGRKLRGQGVRSGGRGVWSPPQQWNSGVQHAHGTGQHVRHPYSTSLKAKDVPGSSPQHRARVPLIFHTCVVIIASCAAAATCAYLRRRRGRNGVQSADVAHLTVRRPVVALTACCGVSDRGGRAVQGEGPTPGTRLEMGMGPGPGAGPGPRSEAELGRSTGSGRDGLVFHVAPMQCYTNPHFNFLCRRLSSKAVLWTEMEKVEDYLARGVDGDLATVAARAFPQPPLGLVLQLGGNDPARLAQAVKVAVETGAYDAVNLNVGCPSVQSGGGATFGAALMRDPPAVRAMVEAMAEAAGGALPVSVKCRIGVHERMPADGRAPEDEYDTLARFVRTVSESGAVRGGVVVHARAAVLSGLSPVKNRTVPVLRYEMVHRLAADFPDLGITLNGGVNSVQQLRRLHRDQATAADGGVPCIDGVMAGRWMLRSPLDLWRIDQEQAVVTRPGHPPGRARRASCVTGALQEYARYAEAMVRTGVANKSVVVLPLLLIVEQLKEDAEAGEERDAEEEAILEAVFEAAQAIAAARGGGVRGGDPGAGCRGPRQLSKHLKQMMGKKVGNKAVRNRAEALGLT